MLYLKHDFYSNFSAGVNSGDNDIIFDLIANETSELIVYRRDELLAFLKQVGINIKPQQSDEKIVTEILNSIPKNTKLIKGLAFLIYENNIKQNQGKQILNDSGTHAQIDNIASGIIGIGDSFEYHPQLKKEFKNKLLDKIETKAKAVGDRNIKIRENNNGKYIAWGLFIVAATATIYLFIKYKNKLVTPTDAVPEVTPPVVATEPVIATNVVEPTISAETVTTALPTETIVTNG